MVVTFRKRRCGRRAAFTLLELIVVVVLTSLLMTATVTVLRSLLRPRASGGSLHPIAVTRIRSDLSNARWYRLPRNRLELRGPLGLDANHLPLWLDAEVSYSVVSTPRGGLLVRSQRLSQFSESIPERQAVWLGISSLAFHTTYWEAGDPLNESNRTSLPDGWLPLPDSFSFELYDADQRVRLSESIVGVNP